MQKKNEPKEGGEVGLGERWCQQNETKIVMAFRQGAMWECLRWVKMEGEQVNGAERGGCENSASVCIWDTPSIFNMDWKRRERRERRREEGVC
jgi:hypothetical protein